LKRLLVAITLAAVSAVTVASEPRLLTDVEKTRLDDFAAAKAGVDAWYSQSSLSESDDRKEGYAMVVFKPARATGYCLAPAAMFIGKSSASEPLVWAAAESVRVEYRFWFESCERADQESAITLKALLDVDTLQRIKDQRENIITEMEQHLDIRRDDTDPSSTLRLTEIDLRYDMERGPVYRIEYSLSQCSRLSAYVVMESGEASVIEAFRVVC
jgi:hypothetical protein